MNTEPKHEEMNTVNHPIHYNYGGIECIEVIRAILGADGTCNFCRGNTLKYLYRAGNKDKEKTVEDLEKALWYLNAEINIRKDMG